MTVLPLKGNEDQIPKIGALLEEVPHTITIITNLSIRLPVEKRN